MPAISPVGQKEVDDLKAAQRRFRQWRSISWGVGAVAVLSAATARPVAGTDNLPLLSAMLVVAAVALLLTILIRFWLNWEAQRLAPLLEADLKRVKADLQAGRTPIITDTGQTEPDWRYVTPEGRKKMKTRRWIFFAVGALMAVLAEYQYKEKGNIAIAAIYAAFAVGSLVYWYLIGQRLRDMA